MFGDDLGTRQNARTTFFGKCADDFADKDFVFAVVQLSDEPGRLLAWGLIVVESYSLLLHPALVNP